MKKNFKMMILPILLSSCLLGCSGNGEGSSGGVENKTITIWWPSNNAYMKVLNSAKAKFEADNPNCTIKIVKKSGLDLYQAYQVALNDDKSRPDIAIIDHVYVQSLANEGQLADLSSLGSDTDVKSLVPENIYNANTYLGKAYALPMSANTVALMYNMTMLKKYGINEPPTTYSEFLADLSTIKSSCESSEVAFAQPINSTFSAMEFVSYVARLGGSLVSDDCKTVKIDSDEVKAAVKEWVKLSKFASQNEYEEGKFYNGKCAFIEMGSWNLSKINYNAVELGIKEMLPLVDGGVGYSGLGLYSLAIASKSSCVNEAYEFAKYLSTDKESQINFAKAGSLFPVTKEALGDSYYTDDQYLSVYASQLEHVTPRPATPIWPFMEKKLVTMLYRCVTASSEETIEQAIATCQSECQEETDRKLG